MRVSDSDSSGTDIRNQGLFDAATMAVLSEPKRVTSNLRDVVAVEMNVGGVIKHDRGIHDIRRLVRRHAIGEVE